MRASPPRRESASWRTPCAHFSLPQAAHLVYSIITSTALLAASDFLLNNSVTYLNPGLRGLEAGDLATISGPNQIRFDTFASTPGDYVRVLTAYSPGAVPEPATLSLLALGLAAGVFRTRARH